MPNVFLWDHVVHAPLTSASDVEALDVTDYVNGVMVNVIDLGIFTYNNSSTATADNITVIEPNVGPGRWLIATPNISSSNAILGSLETPGFLSEIPFTALARSLSAETTAADMRGTLVAAMSGANSDITSITGLTTPLAPNQGGTGTNNGANTLTIGAAASVSGSNTGDQTNITGNAATATALQTARLINGVSFNGTADITVTAAAGTLTGNTLASNVTNTSITGLSTVTSGTWNSTIIGLTYGGTGNTTGTATFAPASGITGGTLASNVTASSLTSFGTVPTFNGVTANLGANTVAGSLNIYPSGNASGLVNFMATSSPGGFNTNITNAAQAATRTYSIPDAGANASFVMTQGTQTIAGTTTFSTPLTVASGGMGSGTHTAYAVLCGGTTTAGAVQSIASVGSSGNVLTSNGAGALPTFQAPVSAGVNRVISQEFTANGTYTPTSGMLYCIVEAVGGGGAGGGTSNASNTTYGGGGGGAGSYSRSVLTAADIGASKAVTIGGGGAGVSGATGNSGGATSLGSLVTANGGSGGAIGFTPNGGAAGAGGTPGTANMVASPGAYGGSGIGLSGGVSLAYSGAGGNSFLCSGAGPSLTIGGSGNSNGTSAAATAYGCGGGGGVVIGAAGSRTGGNGTGGLIVITEFCS